MKQLLELLLLILIGTDITSTQIYERQQQALAEAAEKAKNAAKIATPTNPAPTNTPESTPIEAPTDSTKSTPGALEQFEIVGLNLDLTISLVLTIIFALAYFYRFQTRTVFDLIVGGCFELVTKLQKETLPLVRQYFLMPISYTFMVILGSNLAGLIPYAFTATSSFVVAFYNSASNFIMINLICVLQHR
jgi:hypothetical protein